MHPSRAEGLEWDDANEEELWDHGIRSVEIEEVFLNGPAWARNKKGRSGDYLMVGVTNGGRRLTVPVQVKEAGTLLRPITGWDSSRGELSKYGR
jgi:uncharacterized DUF497 family protein